MRARRMTPAKGSAKAAHQTQPVVARRLFPEGTSVLSQDQHQPGQESTITSCCPYSGNSYGEVHFELEQPLTQVPAAPAKPSSVVHLYRRI